MAESKIGGPAPGLATAIGGPDDTASVPLLRAANVLDHPPAVDSYGVVVRVAGAAIPLPSNAAQETGGNLAALAAKDFALDATVVARLGVLGQAAMAASTPVVIASNQSTVPVSAAALPLPSNAAQEAGGNLASLVAKDFALEATQTAQTATQGATSIGQRGPMVQGVVSDAAHAFEPDAIRPLSLTPDGRLRVATVSESYNSSRWGNPFEQDEAPFNHNIPSAWG